MQQLDGVRLRVCNLRIDEDSTRSAVWLAASKGKKIVRLTGGAGFMSADAAADMYDTFVGAFRGCDIALVAGGTRMLLAPNYIQVKPGITEVLPQIAACSPQAKTIGIVPRLEDTRIVPGVGHVIYNEAEYATIIHPELYACVLLQYSADKSAKSWDEEWRASLGYMELVREDAGHDSLHVVYNGGQFTANEILHVAQLQGYNKPWQLLLVEDSGRAATQFAGDATFRKQYPQVVSCKKHELGQVLTELGFVRHPHTTEENAS